MSTTNGLSDTAKLLAEIDRHEREDADARGRAELSRPPAPELMAAETASTRRFSPRRNRWEDVVAFDQRVADLEARQATLLATIHALHDQLAAAPAADAERLTAWQLAGGKGSRPAATAEPLERQLADAQRDYEALTGAVAAVLAEKAGYVEKHRARLRKDADAAVERAHREMREAVDQVAAAREKLAELRDDAIWAALYPSDEVGQPPMWRLVRGGTVPALKQERERSALARAGITAQLEAVRLLDVLREDADWLKSGATPAQRAALAGVDPRRPPATRWHDSPEGQDERRKEQQATVERLERERTRTAAEWEA